MDVDRHAVLSLDVFDTALLRRVAEPVHVFEIVGEHYAASHGLARPRGFAAARVQAERVARTRGSRARGHSEVTLDEIYDALTLPAGWDREAVRALELETERRVSVVNPTVHALYARALAGGRTIVFASDMYLPREVIAGLLRDAGYGAHKLYVSSELGGRTKRNQGTYRQMLADLGVPAREVLHLGDNHHADVVMARRAGLMAQHVPRAASLAAEARVLPKGTTLAAAIHGGLVAARLFASRGPEDFWHRFGYAQLGMLRDEQVPELVARLRDHEAVRRGARDFADDLAPLLAAWPWLTIDPETARAPLLRVLRDPTPTEARWLGELIGVRPRSWREPVANLRAYATSPWRAGYRARLPGAGWVERARTIWRRLR